VRCCAPGVTPPKVLAKVDPQYSEEARAAKISSTVLRQLVVGVDGKAKDIKVIRRVGFGLDEKAIECIEKWELAPATKDGRPIPVFVTVEVNFRLV
jgi:protein TonB